MYWMSSESSKFSTLVVPFGCNNNIVYTAREAPPPRTCRRRKGKGEGEMEGEGEGERATRQRGERRGSIECRATLRSSFR